MTPALFAAKTPDELAAAIAAGSAGGTPTLDMRQLLASTAANPRNVIESMFLNRGVGLPASLSNVEAVNMPTLPGTALALHQERVVEGKVVALLPLLLPLLRSTPMTKDSVGRAYLAPCLTTSLRAV